MSNEQIILGISAAQLLFAALIFFRIDHRIFRRFMKQPQTAPELPLGLPIKSNRRAKIVLILIFGGLAFSAYGFYRTLQPQKVEEISAANIQADVKQWCDNFGLSVSVKTPTPPNMLFCLQATG